MSTESGVRFELKRTESSASGASYELSLRTAEGQWSGSAKLTPGVSQFALAFEAEHPPEWCLTVVQATLRGVARDSLVKGEFPRRIARWRPRPILSSEAASSEAASSEAASSEAERA